MLCEIVDNLKQLNLGLKQDFAHRRWTKYNAIDWKKDTSETFAKSIDFSAPVTQTTISVSRWNNATVLYFEVESTANQTTSLELSPTLTSFSVGDIPIKRVSYLSDVSGAVVQVAGVRGE